MARRKNVKRIDPRYFLNETVNRNDDGSRLEEEEIEEGLDEMSMIQRLAQAKRLADRDGGSSSDSDDAIYNAFGGSKARMAQDRYDKRKRADAARRRQGVKDDIEMDKWKNRDRTHSQEHGEIEEGFFGGFLGGNRDPWDNSTISTAGNIWRHKGHQYYPGGSGFEDWMRDMVHASFSGKSIEKAAKEYLQAAEKRDPGGEMAKEQLKAFGDKNREAEFRTRDEWKAWGKKIIASLR